jgi:hypothetical protein
MPQYIDAYGFILQSSGAMLLFLASFMPKEK